MDKQQVTELHFTEKQSAAIEKAVKIELQPRKGFFRCLRNNLYKIGKAFVSFIVGVLTLKNTGKWISVITIAAVLSIIITFLKVHAWSIVAMTLVMPYLGQIAIVVFSIIGGFKGANGIIDKVAKNKKLIDTAKSIIKTIPNKKNPMNGG